MKENIRVYLMLMNDPEKLMIQETKTTGVKQQSKGHRKM